MSGQRRTQTAAEVIANSKRLEAIYDEAQAARPTETPKRPLWGCVLCDRLEMGNAERPTHGPCGAYGDCMERLYRADEVAAVLREHALTHIECDHDTKRDTPVCACSRAFLGWHPSVGEAVEAWVQHVSRVLSGSPASE
jgi:hypothetical protein